MDGDTAPGSSARILVVDDEPRVRDTLVELLETEGHSVVACPDGPTALARLEAEPFQLVFTDLGMPSVSGWEIARRVKAGRPGLPVVLVTGWGDQIDAADARARGVDYLVSKPFQRADVTAVVARALAGSR